MNNFTATPTNGTCFANGSIAVQVPGAVNCSNWVAILTPSVGPQQQQNIPANGGPVIFNSLQAGSYNVSLFNGFTTIQAPNNPINISTTYVNMSITSNHTMTTCNPAASNYVQNGTLTVNVGSGTGVGPFIYTCPGAANSPSAPTMSTSYTFTGLPAGTHNFTVTDLVNNQPGCEVTVGQTRVIPVNSTPLPVIGSIKYRRVDCPSDCDNYVLYFPVTNRLTTTNIASTPPPQNITLNTTATISINGGAPQNMPYAITSMLYVDGFQSPTLSAGDTYVVTITNGCHTQTLSGVVPPVSTITLVAVNGSTITTCGTPNYSIGVSITGPTAGNTYFCNDATTVIVGGVGTSSMVPFGSGGTGGVSIAVPGPGTYSVTVTDGCNTIVRSVIVPLIGPNLNAVQIDTTTTTSLRENSGAMYLTAPGALANLPIPHTYSIMPADGSTTKTLTSTHPYNLAGTFTINFPIVRVITTTNSGSNERLVRDLPLGEYDVTFTDNCGNTITRRVNINRPATYNPVVTVTQSCNNSNTVTYALNAPDAVVFNSGRVRLFTNSGGVPGTLLSTIHAEGANTANGYKNGTISNLPAGSYFIVIDRTKQNMYWGYSPIPNAITDEEYRIPFTIAPYQDVVVSTQSLICDINDANSGVVVAQINGGTPVYPLTWQVFSTSNPLTPLQTYTANSSSDTNATQQSFTGLAAGDYFVRVSYLCYSVDNNVTIDGAQVIPQAIVSQSTVCPNSNVVLASFPASDSIYNIVWTDNFGNTVGTGSSINVTVSQTTTYTANISLISSVGCTNAATYTSNVTVTVTPNPDLSLTVSDVDLCQIKGLPATVVISNSQLGFNYELLDQNGDSFSPAITGIGNGGNLIITIPSGNIPTAGIGYIVSTTNGNPACSGNLLDDVMFYEGTPQTNNSITATNVCLGSDAIITVANALNAGNYTVYSSSDLSTAITTVTGNGTNLNITIPATNLTLGSNSFTIQVDGDQCTAAYLDNQATIMVYPNISQSGSTSTSCGSTGVSYTVTATFTGTAPFTATGTGAPGTWIDNGNGTHTWTSDAIPTGSGYNVDIQDTNACNTLNLTAAAPTCCVFEVTCPTFAPTTVSCYSTIPTATTLTEAEFEALGNADGIIGDTPCGVIEITASNSADPGCEGNVIRTYTITEYDDPNNNDIRDVGEDTVLNTQTCTQTYSIEREDFIMPANGSSTITCQSGFGAPTIPIVTDACGNILTPSLPVILSDTSTCLSFVGYFYTFTDCEGNTHEWSYTYIIDRENFTIPVVQNSATVACIAQATEPTAMMLPVVTDDCGNTLTPSAPVVSTMPTCEGDITYTYTYTDCQGNTSDWVYTYTIERADFTMPANASSTVACPADVVAPIVPTVTDACGNTLTPSAPVVSTMPTCEGDVTYNYTFTDCEGNTHDWVYTYTIERADFTMPANASSTVACPADVVAPIVPTVTDACGNTLTPSAPVVSTMQTCEGDVTYTYRFTDCEGNTHDWVYTYTIERADFTMPANASSTVACPADVVAPTVPTVTDACGNTLTPSAPVVSTMPTCEGDVTYTYTFTDCEGNTHDWVYTYTIERADFTMPANASSTVACPADVVAPTVPTVTDACGNTLTPSAPVVSTMPTCEGDVTYTYTFTDCEGNTHDWVYTYTIERADFTMPANASSTIACPADVVAPTVPTVTDACGNTLTPSAPVVSTMPTCEGDVTYTYTFTDCEGNTHDWVYTYTIERADFTMPANASSTVACPADVVTPTVPTVTDACGNTLTPSAPVVSTMPTCEGNITYTYTFTDCEGNTHDWVYTYTIERADFTMPANASSTVACPADVVAPTVPTVTDACGNTLTPSAPVVSTMPTCEGDVTYTYTFTDCEGNTHDWVYTYTIDDNIAPTGTAPVNLTFQCIANVPVADINVITDETDNCTGLVTVTVADTNNGGTGCIGNPYVVTRTYILTDCAGNATNLVQTITVVDDTAPTFVEALPSDLVLECTDVVPTAPILTATDNCSSATVVYNEVRTNGSCPSNYTLTRTWTATDTCGNETTHIQMIDVQDTTPPVFTGELPVDGFADCDNIPVAPTMTATDNCGNVTITLDEQRIDGDCSSRFQLIRTWTATDDCGNSSSYTQTLTLACHVKIWNAVSPNGDTKNDIFYLEGIDCYPNNSVEIYNRWGIKVYETSGYDNINKVFSGYSDGRSTVSRNELLPTGTYFYILKYEYSYDGVNGKQMIDKSGYLYIQNN
ncbi:gliding motility-associated C-terminal domain-containing protein [Flavobacterium aquaticum]|uniref:gliding motility-associated C-terminal domain-containing protein n=1 Tax=Flavobacterium aquaticum TaxID=1236486 RepID=UPI0015ECD643|nr:gliding motility-associated C-terminal domain-containing protein [Flavobacterium aquaticum]